MSPLTHMPRKFLISIEDGEAVFKFNGERIGAPDGVWKLRQLKCWTQKDLAGHLGKKTPSIIKKWESGVAKVPQGDLRLMRYLIEDEVSHPNHTKLSDLS